MTNHEQHRVPLSPGQKARRINLDTDLYGTFAEIGTKLKKRYAHVVTHAEFSIPIANDQDLETLRRLIEDIHAA